jgi:ubiquinone/menaquinone biosynthesis C-methylase UbiE
MTSAISDASQEWGADFFGDLNAMPPEAAAGIIPILEAMGTEPAYREARRTLLADFGLAPNASVIEAGCGTGAALPDLLEVLGRSGHIEGVDPTNAFIEAAKQRAASLGAQAASYKTGDIRALPQGDNTFDAAFCDKVLIHAGPAGAALSEMVRVTKRGGHVGAIEWMPYFVLSSTRPELVARYNGMLRQAVYDYGVSANLAQHFHRAGLVDVSTRAFLAHAGSLGEHPFWRSFLLDQMPMFVHAGLLTAEEGDGLVSDLLMLDARGEFSASFVIQTAVGTKPV